MTRLGNLRPGFAGLHLLDGSASRPARDAGDPRRAPVAVLRAAVPGRRAQARPPPGSLSYFAAIGLGFLLLEIVLIQRFVLFLGFPTYALSVVLFSLLVFTGVGASSRSISRGPSAC